MICPNCKADKQDLDISSHLTKCMKCGHMFWPKRTPPTLITKETFAQYVYTVFGQGETEVKAQENFSNVIGYDRSTICRFINGKKDIPKIFQVLVKNAIESERLKLENIKLKRELSKC